MKKKTNVTPFKILGFLFGIILSHISLSQNFQWANQLSGTSSQTIVGSALDASGNLYVCGKHLGAIDVDPGAGTVSFSGSGFYFGKYDEGGNLVWAQRIAAGGFLREIYGIAYSSSDNSIVLVGSFDVSAPTSMDFDPGVGTAYAPSVQNNSTFIAKYSASDGAYQWVKFVTEQSGSSGYQVIPLCVTSDGAGSVYVGGSFYSNPSFNPVDFDPGTGVVNLTAGGQDGFVLKLNSSGAYQYAYNFGNTVANDEITSLAVDGSNNLYIAGSGSAGLDMDPTTGTAAIPAGGGARDGFLTKLTSAGAFSWAKYFISTGNDLPACVKVSPSGNPHVTGSYAAALKINNTTTNDLPAPTGTSDLFLISYNSTGTLQFATNSAVAGDEKGLDIAFEAGTGGTTVVGFATVSSINSALIYKYTTAGVFSVASNISDGVSMTATCVEAIGNEVIVCGNFSGTADFNPTATTTNLVCTTPTDAFMRKMMNATCVTGTITNISSTAVAVCPGGSSTLTVNGNLNNNNTWEWRSGSCGGTLVGTGATLTVSPTATTTYFVKAIDGCAALSACQSQTLTIQTLPTITATTPGFTCGAGTVAISATPSTSASVQWFTAASGGSALSTGNTFVTPSISANTTYYAGAVINGCVSTSRTAVLATIYTMPSITASTGVTRCGAGSGTLTATANTGTINWLTESLSFLASGTSYATTVSATTNFKVQAYTANCTSPIVTVTFTVNPVPTVSSSTGGQVCGTGSATLSATPSASATIDWYANAAGGSSLASGTSFTTPSLSANTTYYAQAVQGPCVSARAAVLASVVAIPTVTGTTNGSRCGTGTVNLAGTASASATLEWYAASSGGVSIGTGNSFLSPSVSAPTTYYVQAVNSGCTSPRSAVLANVITIPTISSTTPAQRCGSGSATLTAVPSLGSVNWYAAASSGASLFTGNSYAPTSAITTTYYAEAVNGTCVSASRTAVTLTIDPVPTIVSTTPASVCGNASASVTISAAPSAGTISWYTSSSGGVSISSGNSLTQTITSTTTYYAEASNSAPGCTSAVRTSVVAAFKPNPSSGIAAAGNTLTASESNASATYQWYDCNTSSLIAGAIAKSYIPLSSGSYEAHIELNGCSVVTACTPIILSSLGNSMDAYSFKIENPVKNEIHIHSQKTIDGYRILSTDGKLLMQGTLINGETISIKWIPTGVYLIQLQAGEYSETHKLVKSE